MKLSFSPEDEQFREEVADWLQENLRGDFEKLKFRDLAVGERATFAARVMSTPTLMSEKSGNRSWPRGAGPA